ncbi:MAG: N-6 DNA methylase, partial [Dehalococcoidia bacterium]
MTKEEARLKVAELVENYRKLDEKAIKKHSEMDTRRIFIEPLFEALGWNVNSKKEVSEEQQASRGRVDYAFILNGVTRFYLEAKALKADLNKSEFAKQVITYAYGKGIIWAVLSDFEGIKVFNAQTGESCLNLEYQNYLADFDDLWLLSRESFENNDLDNWALKYGKLPPRIGIEQRLFSQLRKWREELFTQINGYNKDFNLTFEQIDEIIERLFNRLIFIRTCEDRRIEDNVLLAGLHEWRDRKPRGDLIDVFRKIFKDFDGYYDSELFAYHLADEVFIDSMALEGIIEGLYDVPGTNASYDFEVIDVDVLGAVYEQYLGHVATVAKTKAKETQTRMDMGLPTDVTFELTAKKQRRKEHGIYYTPRFVTNYIVKETVGRFLEEHSHDEALKVKILDMACGSGSFLIRAYDELLNYHAGVKSKAVTKLDQWERLQLLTGNIYGVDLDMQAVEIARLNLLLRSLARRELLPSLARNILPGNALISGDQKALKPYFGDNWKTKRPFDWEKEFPEIMNKGGFDIIIGNPPYVKIQTLSKDEVPFYKDHYKAATGNYDIYTLFVERAMKLLKPDGLAGLILPTKFFQSQYGQGVRKLLTNEGSIEHIVDFSHEKVFEGVSTYTCLLFFNRKPALSFKYAKMDKLYPNPEIKLEQVRVTTDKRDDSITVGTIPIPDKDGKPWVFSIGQDSALFQKISSNHPFLGDFAQRIFQGLITSADKIYVFIYAGLSDKSGFIRLREQTSNQVIELESSI